MVADIDPLIFELSAFIRAIRGNAFSVASVTSCKILGPEGNREGRKAARISD
jgi:hypothetical protein